MTKDEALNLALEALLRSKRAVSADLDLASCAYGSNDPDGHRYTDAKKALSTLKQAITAIKQARAAPVQEPVAQYSDIVSDGGRDPRNKFDAPPEAPVQGSWHWSDAPVKTQWGDEMVVADLAIDKDHTVSVYCERAQTSKVQAMFTPPTAQRQWVNLTDEQMRQVWYDDALVEGGTYIDKLRQVEAKLKDENNG